MLQRVPHINLLLRLRLHVIEEIFVEGPMRARAKSLNRFVGNRRAGYCQTNLNLVRRFTILPTQGLKITIDDGI